MARSLPTLGEIRQVFRLVGECSELGADPVAWRTHLANGCPELMGEHFVTLVESQLGASPRGTPGLSELDYVTGGTLPNDEHNLIARFMQNSTEISPIARTMLSTMLSKGESSLTRRRCELAPDGSWRRSEFFQDYLLPLDLHDQVTSVEITAPQNVSVIVLHSYGKRKCTSRTAGLLGLLHQELAQLKSEGKLAPLGGSSLLDLSPRQREVLFGLFQGDSEKQLALRLGISRHTVHDYLKTLHRRFGVSSRGELMSRCVRFWPVLARLQNLG